MKFVVLLVVVALFFWMFPPIKRPPQIVVPHCYEPLKGWFMPCAEIDKYYNA